MEVNYLEKNLDAASVFAVFSRSFGQLNFNTGSIRFIAAKCRTVTGNRTAGGMRLAGRYSELSLGRLVHC
jgi:hypothetical protein